MKQITLDYDFAMLDPHVVVKAICKAPTIATIDNEERQNAQEGRANISKASPMVVQVVGESGQGVVLLPHLLKASCSG